MCGIVGVLQTQLDLDKSALGRITEDMAAAIIHRGPDASGVWVGENGRISLAHRRLSILDLSSDGAQPMVGQLGKFCIVFNGEIYNHRQLACELEKEGISFRGHSDTEVLVNACEVWGVHTTLTKLTGMFAFAVWDRLENKLYLARDRMGEKPLYYGWIENSIVFSSELKALRRHPLWRQDNVNRQALALYSRYGYVPTPYSIYSDIHKLIPGSFITLDANQNISRVELGNHPQSKTPFRPVYYWDITQKILDQKKKSAGVAYDTETSVKKLDAELKRAIQDQMIADVPLGGFLSGGVDSTVVVALMQSISSEPINTYTIGFEEKEFNEAEHARAIANHLGTNHTELYISPSDSLEVIPKLAHIYDEPFADSSQIPTYLLCKMAKQHVTVCLTGDAADELFCGYNRYLLTQDIAGKLFKLPQGARRQLARLVKFLPPTIFYRITKILSAIYPKFSSVNSASVRARFQKFILVLESRSYVDLYRNLVSYWHDTQAVVRGCDKPTVGHISEESIIRCLDDIIEQLMYWDLISYLPDDNLVKVDRAAMSCSLETRLPFLDHGVVELALSLPPEQKINNGQSKWILRQVLYQYVPKELIERPKMGFSVPIAAWLRNDLRDWAEDLLDRKKLQNEGYFNSDIVQSRWRAHLNGTHDYSMSLWSILMFQAWLRENQSM